MSISVMNKQFPIKKLLIYLSISVFCIVVNNVYAIFGHGVRSNFMSLMFLYPLVGGMILYIINMLISNDHKQAAYRIGYNLYNSGIAALTLGSFLVGIMEVAGTTSVYNRYFFLTGSGLVGVGVFFLIIALSAKSLRSKL